MDEFYDLTVFSRDNANLKTRYTPQQKILAITILDGNKKERNGIEVPKYTHYSELLNIPVQTLRQWYADKDSIFKENESVARGIILNVQMQMISSLPKVLDKLDESVASGKMKDSDAINYFRELVNKGRLLSNQSTGNIEHQHSVHFEPVPTTQQIK